MATYGTTRRRGLPRVAGGDAWPPVGESPAPVATPVVERPFGSHALAQGESPRDETTAPEEARFDSSLRSSLNDRTVAVRRGLPRVPGGEPWPPAAVAPQPVVERPFGSHALAQGESPRDETTGAEEARFVSSLRSSLNGRAVAVRRGLPRVPGGEPWPPADFVAIPVGERPQQPVVDERDETTTPVEAHVHSSPRSSVDDRTREPLPFPRTVFPGAAAARWNRDRAAGVPVAAPEPRRYGPFTRGQWAGAVIVGGLGLLFAAGMLVLAVRWFLSLDFMQDFVGTYPGEYHLPVGAPVGFPAWVGWQHFFNVFLMVLIIRSGLTVRSEKRPTAFWSPRTNPKRKISLTLWFHQSLDILWLVNGVIFVVLLFVTGQWLRIVPSSWEVFPNAITAALKYVSLNWPTEDGWVNYNALQQLAYFATVFLAAPLAAATGVRMSGVWPKNAKTLNKAYPVEWARAIHFPVMIYFVLFIIVHVALVFATGALRNLNHMYGGSDQVNWIGFWIFIASMVVIAVGWIAARPLILAPIARLFGTVSGR